MNEKYQLQADDDFIKAILAEDELGAVVRSHIFVEAKLTHFLELSLVNPKFIVAESKNTNYALKVDLACGLGLSSDYHDALRYLGSIRNRFAHKLGTSISKDMTDTLYEKLPLQGKQATEGAYQITKSALRTSGIKRVTDLLPRDKFVMVVLTLERMLTAAIIHRESEQGKNQP